MSHFGIKILVRWFCLHFDMWSCPVCVIFKRVWDRSMSSQNNLTKSRHVSNINLENFGSILPWPTCVPPTYLLYLLPRPSRQVPEVPYCTVKHLYCSSAIFLHYEIACACLKGIFFHHMSLVYLLPLPSQQPPNTVLYVHTGQRMPKVSSFMLRAESVRIKPLQRLPTVCTISLTPKGEHHIRPTLLPRPVLHLILVNFADNLVCLCFFQFKSAFEQIWVRSLDWVVCPQSLSSRDRTLLSDKVYVIIFRGRLTQNPLALTIRTLKTNLLTCYTFTILETCNLPHHNLQQRCQKVILSSSGTSDYLKGCQRHFHSSNGSSGGCSSGY